MIFVVFLGLGGLMGCASISSENQPEEPQDIEPTESGMVQGTELPQATPIVPTVPQETQLYERRLMNLEWPERIRVGESDRIQLVIQVDETGKITPTAVNGDHEITIEPILIPDLYDYYYLNVEARIDIAGMDVLPDGTVSTALVKGKDVVFAWSLSPRQVGSFSGTVWLYLNIIPKEDGVTHQELLLAKPITINSVTVFGLPANVARWGGVLGTGFSFILGIPFFEEIVGWILKQVKKRNYSKI